MLRLEGSLRAPVRPELRRRVEELIGCGRRAIVLDLAKVTGLDAEGVGELARAYALADGAGGHLWIENAPLRVRALLDRAGLFELLSTGPRHADAQEAVAS